MSALTRQNVVDNARDLLNATGDLNWSDALTVRQADAANRYVWDLLCDADPTWAMTRTSFTWPAGTERLDLTAAGQLNAEPKRILDVYETDSAGAPSDSNLTSPWTPIAQRHRHQRQDRGRLRTWSTGKGPTAWSLTGNFMYAVPVPTSARNVHVEWIPQVIALSAVGTEVLSGQGEQFGDVVTLRLAVLMNTKDNFNPAIRDLWTEEEERLRNQAFRRQSQRNRIVGSQGWA